MREGPNSSVLRNLAWPRVVVRIALLRISLELSLALPALAGVTGLRYRPQPSRPGGQRIGGARAPAPHRQRGGASMMSVRRVDQRQFAATFGLAEGRKRPTQIS